MSCAHEFQFFQGAVGDAERFEWRLQARDGIDFTGFTSRSLTMQVRAPSGAVSTLGPWVLFSVTASVITFRFTPLGNEFPELGVHTFAPTLTLDATITRYRATLGKVNSRWSHHE